MAQEATEHGSSLMSATFPNRMRLLRVTVGNLRNNNISVRGHLDFFPADALGPSKKPADVNGHAIGLQLAGFDTTVKTDIAADKGIFRERRWVRRFFKQHSIRSGDLLALERIGDHDYRLSPARPAVGDGKSFIAAEFFAGIGLVRLALERHGWQVAFANDIEPDKAEMYPYNCRMTTFRSSAVSAN